MSEPQSPTGWTGLAKTVLEFVSTPWRALFLVIVGILAGIGFLIWEERVHIRDYLISRKPAKAVLRTASTAQTITTLFYTTHVDAVSIWALNLHDNTAEYLSGRRRDGTPWLITPRILQLFTENSMPTVTAKLLRSEPVCADPAQSKSLLGKAMVEDGMNWACFVPEPPSARELLVGYVLLGFRAKPDEAVANAAIAATWKETDNIIIR